MFDLNKGVEQWKISLSQYDSISQKNVIELESHLLDEIEDLKEKGLSDKEAFWVARNRIGEERLLQTEFKKSNIKELYLNRFSWIIFGGLIFQFISLLGNIVYNSVYIFAMSNNFDTLESYTVGTIAYYFIFALPIIIGYLLYKKYKSGNNTLSYVLSKKLKTGSAYLVLIFLLSVGISVFLFYLGNVMMELNTVYYRTSGRSSIMEYARYLIILNPVVLISFLALALRFMNNKEAKLNEVRL